MKRIPRSLVLFLALLLAWASLSPRVFAKSLSNAQLSASTDKKVAAWSMTPAAFVSAYNDHAKGSAVEIKKFNKSADSTVKLGKITLGIAVTDKGSVRQIQASLPLKNKTSFDPFGECVADIMLALMQDDADAAIGVFNNLGISPDADSLRAGYTQSKTQGSVVYKYAVTETKILFTATPKAAKGS